jgi:glutamate-5-semialdehyde dehydrogenase
MINSIPMTAMTDAELARYCQEVAQRGKLASRRLAGLSGQTKNQWLNDSALAIENSVELLLSANRQDVAAAQEMNLTAAGIDRLTLTPVSIAAIAKGLREVAALPDPVGETIEGSIRPNGLEVRKVRVPLGTVFFIYESRPNVTVDAAAICVKSGNAVILRGGKEARHSSAEFVRLLNRVGQTVGIPVDAVQLVETQDRAAVTHFLKLEQLIDVAIPRGGRGLIELVVEQARMPVIKHFDGNCHIFVDKTANTQQALDIVINSKCQRMGVCNACESLLIHQEIAANFLPQIASALIEQGIEIRGDEAVCRMIAQAKPGSQTDWRAEYLGPIISVCVVSDLAAAIDHINLFGSGHTDAIITEDLRSARLFQQQIDSSAVIVNASTRFNDGGELGLGAEIGISTDKFHARGPCGLREMTTYKYLVTGTGQIRR